MTRENLLFNVRNYTAVKNAYNLNARVQGSKLDKGGNPQVEHSIRVASVFNTPEVQTIALLHDVLEDSDYTALDLVKSFGFDDTTAASVELLTFRPEYYNYTDYIHSIYTHRISFPEAFYVKVADIGDNMSRNRLALLPTKERRRLIDKYENALRIMFP